MITKDCPSECASGGERERVACIVGKVAQGLVEYGLGPFLARVGGWSHGRPFFQATMLTMPQKDCIEFEEKATKDATGKKIKRKQTVLRTRKSIGADKGSDDDDDFKPIKAAALKRKPAEPKKAAKGKDEDRVPKKEDAPPKRSVAQKKVVKDEGSDDDFDAEDAYARVTSAKGKIAPMKKGIVSKKKVESDEDDDGETKAAPAKRTVPPKQTIELSSDEEGLAPSKPTAPLKTAAPTGKILGPDDDDDEFLERAPVKAKTAPAKAPTGKNLDLDDDDDEFQERAPVKAKAAPAKKAAKAGPSKKRVVSESESEEVEVMAARPPTKRRAATSKAVVVESDSESDVPKTKGKGKAKRKR